MADAPADRAREALVTVEIPKADYDRLLQAAEADDMVVYCETCGAWLDRDDEATATTDDYTGCWKIATGRNEDEHLCRSYRASV